MWIEGTGQIVAAFARGLDPAVDLAIEGLQRDGVGVQLVLQLEDLAAEPTVLTEQRGDRVLQFDNARRQPARLGRRRQTACGA